MSKKEEYILDNFIRFRFGDPINALNMAKNYLIMGSMSGRISLYDIKNKKTILLSKSNSEEISDISYNKQENCFYVGIGDDEIKIFKIDNLSDDTIEPIKVYESKEIHKNNCEDAFILLSPESLFRIQLAKSNESSTTITETNQEYELKMFHKDNNSNNHIGKLPMTNYSVPLDFDGTKFLWVEFLESGDRNICIADISIGDENNRPYKFKLIKNNQTIGHISMAKILSKERIFIVHSLNKCEIRLLDDLFSLSEEFMHIGEEVS
jgi:WD40 repeat protein